MTCNSDNSYTPEYTCTVHNINVPHSILIHILFNVSDHVKYLAIQNKYIETHIRIQWIIANKYSEERIHWCVHISVSVFEGFFFHSFFFLLSPHLAHSYIHSYMPDRLQRYETTRLVCVWVLTSSQAFEFRSVYFSYCWKVEQNGSLEFMLRKVESLRVICLSIKAISLKLN